MSSAAFNFTTSRFKTFCDTNDDLPTSTARDPDRIGHIPDHHPTMERANDGALTQLESRLKCCCGRPECMYLEHNNAALGGIESNLEKAARLGQALLTRHESYVNESQLEHARLSGQVIDLDADRNSLQSANEKIVAENRELLAQLETLNSSYQSSDNHVKNLENLLRDCEVEVRRLHALARRAEELEVQVLAMDKQNLVLARKLEDGQQENRSTMMRWRESERRLKTLENEVQKIEWEARRERERHEEVVARLERERTVERELGGAEGRLKGAAAVQSLDGAGRNTKVVSHFVRDILQDNANLQAGIVELRELLQTSNEEVQNLRDQVMHHQPVDVDHRDAALSKSVPLDDHLGWPEPSQMQVQREVHVHHHYHAKLAPKRERTPTARRNSRRKALMGPGGLATTPESSVPSTPISRPQRYNSSSVVPFSLHQPQPKKNRWSMQSAATMSSTTSSLPSSPRSYYERNSSIFDRIELGEESSRPTSPESNAEVTSPASELRNQEVRKGEGRLDTFEEVMELEEDEDEVVYSPMIEDDAMATPRAESGPQDQAVTSMVDLKNDGPTPSQDLTTNPSVLLNTTSATTIDTGPLPSQPVNIAPPERRPPDIDKISTEEPARLVTPKPMDQPTRRPSPPQLSQDIPKIRSTLHRSSSADSLVSISGMDIHIHAREPPTSSPFALLRSAGNSAHFARRPPSTSRSISASQPVASVTEFTVISAAAASWQKRNSQGAGVSGKSIEALSGIAGLPPTIGSEQPPSGSIGRLVGGWVRGRWGIAPMKSSGDLRTQVARQRSQTVLPQQPALPVAVSVPGAGPGTSSKNPDTTTVVGSMAFGGGRKPGINQQGAIPGFWVPKRAPSELHAKVIDEEGLKEVLAE